MFSTKVGIRRRHAVERLVIALVVVVGDEVSQRSLPSRAQAHSAGHDPDDASHHLLLAGDVKRPGVILRNLNTAAGQGLKATDAWAAQGRVTPEQCRAVLGEAYPTVSVRSGRGIP